MPTGPNNPIICSPSAAGTWLCVGTFEVTLHTPEQRSVLFLPKLPATIAKTFLRDFSESRDRRDVVQTCTDASNRDDFFDIGIIMIHPLLANLSPENQNWPKFEVTRHRAGNCSYPPQWVRGGYRRKKIQRWSKNLDRSLLAAACVIWLVSDLKWIFTR